MKTCPTCQGSGQVPDYIATALNGNHDDPQCSHLTRTPVLVVDSAEARQKVAEALFSMGFEAPWIYADAVFAALGGQGHLPCSEHEDPR